jgi:hypothetical protein
MSRASSRHPKNSVFFKKTKIPGYEILPPIYIPVKFYEELTALAKKSNINVEELVIKIIEDRLQQYKKSEQSKTELSAKKLKAEDVLAVIKDVWGTKPFIFDDILKLLPVLGITEGELIDMLSELCEEDVLNYDDKNDVFTLKHL